MLLHDGEYNISGLLLHLFIKYKKPSFANFPYLSSFLLIFVEQFLNSYLDLVGIILFFTQYYSSLEIIYSIHSEEECDLKLKSGSIHSLIKDLGRA